MLPHTPLSTPLSGSAKETQTRIRNIFQFQKKRPPLLALTLATALALSCGGLVSCQNPAEQEIDQADFPLPFSGNLPGEPLKLTFPVWQSLSEYPGELNLKGLTVDTLPATPVNLRDFSQSESWNETVWLLSQDTERDAALYGVIQFENYTPGLNASDKLYGVILRAGEQFAYFPFDWDANLWAYQVPELWRGDFDGDGQEELAFALAYVHGSQVWAENLYLFEPDTLEYQAIVLASGGLNLSGLTASYDPESLTLYAATEDRLLMLDESWVEGAPILEGFLQGGSRVEFSLRDGTLWCTLALIPSKAPLSNPVILDCPVVFQNGTYVLGDPELSSESLPVSEEYAPSTDRLLWVDENGGVMQAATQEEYAAGGTPVESEDGYLYFRF